MSTTVFCKSFIDEILELYKSKNLKIALVNNGASPSAMGSSLINKSEINEFIIAGTEKNIVQEEIEDSQLNAETVTWSNATFDARYAIIYEDENGNIIFFIDLGSVKSIVNDTFEIQWTDGFIKIV